MFAPKIIKIY